MYIASSSEDGLDRINKSPQNAIIENQKIDADKEDERAGEIVPLLTMGDISIQLEVEK